MALSKRSIEQAKQLLRNILDSNVDVIVTRATLDKKIELIKFPYLKASHDRDPKNRTLYTSQQYDPIRYWLINNKFLTASKDSWGRYNYRVNRDAISTYLQSSAVTEQSNNIKNENKQVMTKREKIFRHIEDNGNAMRYTDIIKFAYEIDHGKNSFDKKINRGYYASAFTHHSYWSAGYNNPKKRIGSPKGHFVIETRTGYLKKLPNGLWSVVRPYGWTRSEANCETYETRIEKFLSDGKTVTEREIVSYLKPYVVSNRKIGYDWGNTNGLLRKMIEKGKVVREIDINSKTGRPAYHYSLNMALVPHINETTVLEDGEYESMCEVLSKYNITPDQFDDLATNYLHNKNGDATSCYHWAYYDLLEKAGAISDTTKELQKEIDNIVHQSSAKQKAKQYIILNTKIDDYEGLFTTDEVEDFFNCDRDPKNYLVIEAGDIVTIEKKTTTTITIKK